MANGYPSLNFDNDSPYQLVMNEIDTTKFREGIITVIDSGLLTKAEYKFLPATNQIQERRYTGQLVTGGNDNDGTDDGQVSSIQYTLQSTNLHAFGSSLQYAVPAGLQYVWTEGQRLNKQTITRYVRDDSWYTSFLPFIDFDESTATSEESFLEPRPMLESELRLLTGTAGVDSNGVDIDGIPDYAVGSAYSIAYLRFVGDPRTTMPAGALVRNPPLLVNLQQFPPIVDVPDNSKVYEYAGAAGELIDLSLADYTNTALWSERNDIDAQNFQPDNITQFDSSFRNRRSSITSPVEIDDDIYETIKTVVAGQKDMYTHTLKADFPIGIVFGNSPTTPSINISSHGGIRFLTSVYAPTSATMQLTSTGGSIVADDAAVIFGTNPVVIAAGDVDLQIEGDVGSLNIFAGGDIDVTAVSTDNVSSSFSVTLVSSTGGDVFIHAPDGLTNASPTAKVKGDRIELEVMRGAIGSASSPLRIEANILGTGGLRQSPMTMSRSRKPQAICRYCAPAALPPMLRSYR